MSGLDAPEIAAAYAAVRDDRDPCNWLLLTNPPPSSADPATSATASTTSTTIPTTTTPSPDSKTLVLARTGTGGLAELRSTLSSSGSEVDYSSSVAYGYVRVSYSIDAESTRTKFVFVVWIGERTRVMRKARVSVEAGDVARVLSHASVRVEAGTPDDLADHDIVARLRKAGGADYNGGRG